MEPFIFVASDNSVRDCLYTALKSQLIYGVKAACKACFVRAAV